MNVAIHQPQYMPWLGYLNKIARADCFIFLDDVQYKKNEWQNRNRIKTAQGPAWLTVPVSYRFGMRIVDVHIDNGTDWAKSHLRSLEVHYHKAPFFSDHFEPLRRLLSTRWEGIAELNVATVRYLLDAWGIHPRLERSSAFAVSGTKSQRLVALCNAVGADRYISGDGAREYLDERIFADAGIGLEFQSFQHPVYRQLYGEFIPQLSALDVLLNEGPRGADLLKGSA